MKIVADRQIPFLNAVLEPFAQVVYLDGEEITADIVRDADALLVRTRTRCDASLLEGSSVKFVGTATIGTDHIDTQWCESAGIAWSNAPGCNADAVCQYIVASLLSVSVRHGIPLDDKVLGIIGVGQVGSRVAKAAKTLGMKVLLCDPPRAEREGRKGFSSLSTLFQECDFFTFHTPLEKSGKHATWRLANGGFLSKVKPHAWLINSSRGAVVDNTALRIALRSNSIAGAVLDVWEGEPDQIDQELLHLLEMATPHIAGYSLEGKANGTTQIIRALAQILDVKSLKSWQIPADELSPPRDPLIRIDAGSGPDELWLHEAVFRSYDVRADDADLRHDPSSFELLRSRYAFRREFPAFKVELKNGSPSLAEKLRGLGFAVTVAR
jgi:erythronate-4-phosphate dehydrogenase